MRYFLEELRSLLEAPDNEPANPLKYIPHEKSTASDEDLEASHTAFLGDVHGFDVYLVSGEEVRNRIDIDFTQGGNSGRYLYVPDGEIWIEDTLSPLDVLATLVHEIQEFQWMYAGDGYEPAHDKALENERKLREQWGAEDFELGDVAEIATGILTKKPA